MELFQQITGQLEPRLTDALIGHAMTNRGSFPAFRLPAAAQAIVVALREGADQARAQALGSELGQQGLSLASAFAAQAAALLAVVELADPSERARLTEGLCLFFGALVEGLSNADQSELERQRKDMERAFMRSISEQREQEDQLRNAIRELSTPIIPVHDGVLVLPLVGSVDSRRASEINERLLEGIAEHQAEIVIIDITGVSVMDTSTANLLLMTARAANLLGSRIVLVGIGAEVAQTITHLGVELRGITTLANLQSGIAYALEQMGLGIQPL